MVLGTALAVIGGLLLLVGLLAVLGLSSIVPGDAVASGIQGIFQVFFNWWQLWLPILIIGLVAYIARSGRGGNSTTDTVIGAAEGAASSWFDNNSEGTDYSSSRNSNNSSNRNRSSGTASNSGRQVGQFSNSTENVEPSTDHNSSRDRSNINTRSQNTNMSNDMELLNRLVEDEQEAKNLHQNVSEMEGNEEQYLKVVSGIEKTLQKSGVFDELKRFENDNIGKAQFYNEMHKIGEKFADSFHGNVSGVPTGGILSGTADNINGLIEADSTGADSGLIALYNGLIALEHYIEKLDHVEHEIVEVETTEVEDHKEEMNLAGQLKSHHMQHLQLLQNHLK